MWDAHKELKLDLFTSLWLFQMQKLNVICEHVVDSNVHIWKDAWLNILLAESLPDPQRERFPFLSFPLSLYIIMYC